MASYQVPAKSAQASIVEKKSEFIARIGHVETESQALTFLEEVRANQRTARHNVYAYVLREGTRQRYSDDGEPAKTAGLPVLQAIGHAGLTDCIVVVTRYFGGVLLGTGGLVRAYTAAAKAAIQAAGVSTVRLCSRICFSVEYSLYEPTRRLIEAAGARLDEPLFTDRVALAATLPAERAPALLQKLDEACRGQASIHTGEPFYIPFEEAGSTHDE